MVQVTVISPATDRGGSAVPSYSKDKSGHSLVKRGVERSVLSFSTYTEAVRYISDNRQNVYSMQRPGRGSKVGV